MTDINVVFYLDSYRYTRSLAEHETYNVVKDLLRTPPKHQTGLEEAYFYFQENWFLKIDHEDYLLSESEAVTLTTSSGQEVRIWLQAHNSQQIFATLEAQTVRVGNESGADLQAKTSDLDLLLEKEDLQWQGTSFVEGLYLNNLRLTTTHFTLNPGDELSVGPYWLKVFPDELLVTGDLLDSTTLTEVFTSSHELYAEYPDYHRSPRIIYREPEAEVSVDAPPAEAQKPTDQLLKTILPPLIMLIMTIVMAFLTKRGIYVIATAATTLVTLIFSITNFFKNKKNYKQEVIDRKENYEMYLTEKAIELRQLSQEHRFGQLYHYPGITDLLMMAKTYSPRLYEKTPLHHDFLFYRLGLGKVSASSKITYSNKERTTKGDALEQKGFELYEQYTVNDTMPITANLISGPVGYIGPRPLVIEQLQLLVNQLAVFHSYHDLQMISIFPEEEYNQWEWMSWLPHATLQEMNVRGFVYNQRSRDQVLNSLNQILKNRQNTLNEEKNKRDSTIFSPHYVVLITDEKLVLDHIIMEFFNEDPSKLGCSVIFVQDVMSSLSENIQTVIDIRDRRTGVLTLEEGNLKNISFALEHFPANFDKEELPRLLAPINHLQNLKSSIPENITFMEMYGVERIEELEILKRWEAHSPHKTLAVPLGLRGKDDIVELNLHEKAHGPHGLVAGTTGSGKSEIVQSYIISLAVNFHPYDVAFLLIDYKGGGMANLFRNLPHLLGTITNLDGAQSMRALISINAELKRRQRLFSENNVNHINQYQKLYKSGDVSEPMPHLFLISDEFAELKAEQPEFMAELVSTARIGRSLGIHLILATQKPSGVVDDQIWSNSKFKLALKVADKSDSMEMLKTPDAAEITLPGRAYLQVGNNEIYELFQSAWSGADYQPDKDAQQIEDHTIYKINDLGQYDILSEDLSGLENVDDVKQIPTELDAVVNGINELVQAQGIETLPSPWLPPLPERVTLPDLHPLAYQTLWQGAKQLLQPVIGMIDLPSLQAQETLQLDLSNDGHVAIFASPGYGKSNFIQTVVMDLARSHNPARLHVYLLDFGTNGLLPLRNLPHVADTMSIDEAEKIGKFVRRIEAEMKRRKKLLSEYSVASLTMYEQASDKEEPIILIPIDGFEGIKGNSFEDSLEKMVTTVAREGAGVGIHLIISAGRQSAMRMNLHGNIKIQIPLKMIDDSEPRTIVGRTDLIIDDLAGRGLFKTEEGPETFQVALPNDGSDPLEIIEGIRQEATAMDEYWTGERAEEIPMVPEVLQFEEFRHRKLVVQAIESGLMPIGVDFELVRPVQIDYANMKNLLLVSDNETSFSNLLTNILNISNELLEDVNVMILDSDNNLNEYESKVRTYVYGEENLSGFTENLTLEISNRKETGQFEQWFVLIDRLDTFVKQSGVSESEFTNIFDEAPKVGIHLIINSFYNYVGTSYETIPKYVKSNSQQTILAMRLTDQNMYDKPYQSKEEYLLTDEAFYYNNNSFVKIKFTS